MHHHIFHFSCKPYMRMKIYSQVLISVCLLDFFCSGVRFCLLLSPCLCFVSLLNLDLYVLEDDALTGFMQTNYLCVLIHTLYKGEFGAPLNRFKPYSKIFLLTVPRRCFFLWIIMLFLLCFHAYLFVDALWSAAGNDLTSWLSFVMSNCDVTFPLVSCVR